MSKIRKNYFIRLLWRCAVFAYCVFLRFCQQSSFGLPDGKSFFTEFSFLHVLWCLWMFDMLCQIVPIQQTLALGSRKLFRRAFRPAQKAPGRAALQRYIRQSTKGAAKVMLLWITLGAVIGALYYNGLFAPADLFLLTAAFYVCDLICVLLWCPFRLILKNKCCTTCRIFNWDHLMMFTPLLFVPGFYSRSLFGMAAVVWAVWEGSVLFHPERFWETSNEALQCSSCTDKLCTQYCQKHRR